MIPSNLELSATDANLYQAICREYIMKNTISPPKNDHDFNSNIVPIIYYSVCMNKNITDLKKFEE
jgi:hypothetical protein